MFSYVVRHQNSYLRIQNGCVIWTRLEDCNKYTSKYAAKKHIRQFEMPNELTIEMKGNEDD